MGGRKEGYLALFEDAGEVDGRADEDKGVEAREAIERLLLGCQVDLRGRHVNGAHGVGAEDVVDLLLVHLCHGSAGWLEAACRHPGVLCELVQRDPLLGVHRHHFAEGRADLLAEPPRDLVLGLGDVLEEGRERRLVVREAPCHDDVENHPCGPQTHCTAIKSIASGMSTSFHTKGFG